MPPRYNISASQHLQRQCAQEILRAVRRCELTLNWRYRRRSDDIRPTVNDTLFRRYLSAISDFPIWPTAAMLIVHELAI